MHCFERTLWFFFLMAVTGKISCQAAPTAERKVQSPNESATKTNPEMETGFNPRINLSGPIPSETDDKAVGRQNLAIPHLRSPVHTGPGNYLENRRRQTENRIQELENQVNVLLEAQKKGGIIPDPERESQTAIQYGLNCERGETVLVCLMKKVVLLRREVSGIQRDVSALGKKFAFMELDMQDIYTDRGDGKGTDKEERNGGQPTTHDGQRPEFPLSEFDNATTSTNGTTESPLDNLPQQDPLCPSRFERVGNVCYYVVTDRVNGVTSARDFCQTHGGFLARPRDSLTIHDLANHLTRLHDKGNNQLSELWVDGKYQTEKETWKWNDGQAIDRSIWGISDTPTKAHEIDTCVLLKKELNYLAMPQDCGYHYFFVCQAEKRDDIPAM